MVLHPGRVVETSESQPRVVGVVVVVNVVIVVSVPSNVQQSDTVAHVDVFEISNKTAARV